MGPAFGFLREAPTPYAAPVLPAGFAPSKGWGSRRDPGPTCPKQSGRAATGAPLHTLLPAFRMKVVVTPTGF